MIKLLRTHPRHLTGTRFTSSSSPRLPIHGPHEAPRFGQVLQETLDAGTNSPPAGVKATSLRQNSVSLLSSPKGVHQNHMISPVGPTGSHPARATNSALTSSKGPGDFEPFIKETSRNFGVERRLIQAVIKAESSFNPRAKSRSGAVGLMQLLPSTGREMGVRDLYDPRDNITGGTRYLAMLLDRYKGNLKMALAGYNWGPGNVEKSPDRLPRETEKYIQRVLRYLETLTA